MSAWSVREDSETVLEIIMLHAAVVIVCTKAQKAPGMYRGVGLACLARERFHTTCFNE